MQPLEARQQRGVDVDHAVAPALDETGGHEPHETGERDDVHARHAEHALQLALEVLAVLVELVIEAERGNALRLRPGKTRRVGPVGNHRHDLGRIVGSRARPRPAPSCSSRGPRSGWRRAFSQTLEHAFVIHGPGLALALGRTPLAGRRGDLADDDGASPHSCRGARGASAPCLATTTTMPMPQLNVRSISASSRRPALASQPNTAGALPTREIDRRRDGRRQHARQVLGEAAAGDVGQRLDRRRPAPPVASSAASTGFT